MSKTLTIEHKICGQTSFDSMPSLLKNYIPWSSLLFPATFHGGRPYARMNVHSAARQAIHHSTSLERCTNAYLKIKLKVCAKSRFEGFSVMTNIIVIQNIYFDSIAYINLSFSSGRLLALWCHVL